MSNNNSTLAARPVALKEAGKRSLTRWQNDLESLFDHAKERFADVVWEILDHDEKRSGEEVWGHKAIVYARAPPGFQSRYFSFRQPPISSPTPYPPSPIPGQLAQSSVSLSIGVDFNNFSRSPSPYGTEKRDHMISPAPSTNGGGILRIPQMISPALFSGELRYLYTGQGFGEAFEFLFDSAEKGEEGDAEENRVSKLRKDLVFMWRSRLYSDVRLVVSSDSQNHPEASTAVFTSHRFILVSRSPYFRNLLLGGWAVPKADSTSPTSLTLPSPPFTPAATHFTLGFLYTGTLKFSHRTFDLDTAFAIMRSASFISLDTLYEETQAIVVQEMMHGLFHAFLEFAEYERITGGKWGTGGCRCRQCARRAPRLLTFAVADDVHNPHIERGARRALVGLFGEGWCNSEFAKLPQKTRESLLKGLSKRTNPQNIFPLLFAAEAAMTKLNSNIELWADTVREMVLIARQTIDTVLCKEAEACFEQQEWVDIMAADGARFEDGEKVTAVMESIRRGLIHQNAGMVYQVLVSSVLLRPHRTDANQAMLSSTSHIRVQVEETRTDIIKWLKKHWVNTKLEGGFDALESWALKEISGEIEVPVDDLLTAAPKPSPSSRSTHRGKAPDVENDSVMSTAASLRATVLNRNMARSNGPGTSAQHVPLPPSTASVRSVARSTTSTVSRVTLTSRRPTAAEKTVSPSTRKSKQDETSSITPSTTSRINRSASRTPSISPSLDRPKSSAASVRSHATIRKPSSTQTTSPPGPSTLKVPGSSRPNSVSPRPSSTMSTRSDASSTFKTAKSTHTRRVSTASNASVATERKRRVSTASTASANPAQTHPKSPQGSTGPSTKKQKALESSKSSSASQPPVPDKSPFLKPRKPSSHRPESQEHKPPESPSSEMAQTLTPTPSTIGKVQEKENELTGSEPTPTRSSISGRSDGGSTLRVSHKGSQETITLPPPRLPKGDTLDIGIPCIISSKRTRFRAFARYIGEVEGESGPWVGVEVPIGVESKEKLLDGRDWHDGSWCGVRYFEIHGGGSEWAEDNEERASRRRRLDWVNSLVSRSLKREGDTLSVERSKRVRSASPATSDVSMSGGETRGLFVRPQQVLYVVDAVGADL